MVIMRKVLLVFVLILAWGSLRAQERTIKMPDSPSKLYNIAEEDYGTFWCAIELGGGSTAMENKQNVAMIGASYTGGYRFCQYLKIGAGLGVLYYPNSSNVRDTKNHLSMPIFINARGNMLSDEIRRTVPFWSINLGTSIPDGLFMTPSVGLRVGEKRNAFLVSIGYTLRHMKSYPESISNYSGVLLKLGYEF